MKSIVEFSGAPLYLTGDVHGNWNSIRRLMKSATLMDDTGLVDFPQGSVMIQVGDLIDRGHQTKTKAPLPASRDDLPARLSLVTRLEPGSLRAPAPEMFRSGTSVALEDVASGMPDWPAPLLAQEQSALSDACDGIATIRLFMQLEADVQAAGSRLICLMGNHELDLLRGRFHYANRQKQYFLTLLGLEPDMVEEHAARGLPCSTLLDSGSRELSWLFERPFLAIGEGIVAVHGGPVNDLFQNLICSTF